MADQYLSDVDRRTIGNLSIPRNVPNLTQELRDDQHSPTRPLDEVHEHLMDLEANGLVANIGEHPDVAKVPGVVEKHKTALTMPDDQAKIYAQRLAHPRHEWRAQGDLWVVTTDGVDAMKAPPVESPAVPASQVQALIDAEWARTLKGVTSDSYDGAKHGPLAGALLEDEFMFWAKQVQAECKRVWNTQPKLPLAGGAGKTDTYENLVLDQENQKVVVGALVDPWFMALSIFAYTDTDTGATHGDATRLPTYTGYAAKSVAGTDMASAAAGSAANTSAITFAACTASSSAIIGFGNNSVVTNTSGTFRKYGACSSTTVSTTQTPATFAIGAYVTTED